MSAAAAKFHPVVQEALTLLTEEGPEPVNLPAENKRVLQRALLSCPPPQLPHAVMGMLTMVEAIRRQGSAITALDILEIIVSAAPVLHRMGAAAKGAVDQIQQTAKSVFQAAPEEYTRRNEGLSKPKARRSSVGIRSPIAQPRIRPPVPGKPGPFEDI